MQNGQDVAREISRKLTTAEQDVARIGQQLQGLRAELDGVRTEEARTIAALAKVRLGELDADRITTGLDTADREALAAFAAGHCGDASRVRRQRQADGAAAAATTPPRP